MRATNIKSVEYTPNQVPENAAEMRRFLFDELNSISAAIRALAEGHIDKSTVAPTKPRDGDIRYASGAPNWNPGSGAGIYYYNGTTWIFIG